MNPKMSQRTAWVCVVVASLLSWIVIGNCSVGVAQTESKQEQTVSVQKIALPGALKVPSEVRGIVKEVLVKEGQRVKKGDVLLRLDDRLAQLAVRIAGLKVRKAQSDVDVARAEIGEAKSQYDRIMTQFKLRPESVLAEEMSMRKCTWDKATYEADARKVLVLAAEAELEISRLQMDKTVIRAPAAGVVQRIHLQPGEAVQRELETVVQLKVGEKE
jgi:HlyD family secretion protein